MQVPGYPWRERPADWRPDESLKAFLEQHAAKGVLFATFGSMTNPAPERRTEALLDVLLRHRIPAIINTASGGLVRLDHLRTDLVHFVSEVPYEHIFPRIRAVVHHGGSGTTHAALRAGCPTLVVPHIIDQLVWGSMVEDPGETQCAELSRDSRS